jgi:hypothetical protein
MRRIVGGNSEAKRPSEGEIRLEAFQEGGGRHHQSFGGAVLDVAAGVDANCAPTDRVEGADQDAGGRLQRAIWSHEINSGDHRSQVSKWQSD